MYTIFYNEELEILAKDLNYSFEHKIGDQIFLENEQYEIYHIASHFIVSDIDKSIKQKTYKIYMTQF